MSLINDALKTAQRAKQARDSGMRPAPILVPLKPQAKNSAFSWRRSLAVAGALVVVAGVGWLAMGRVRSETLRPLQPQPSVLLGEPAATASSADSSHRAAANVPAESSIVQQQQRPTKPPTRRTSPPQRAQSLASAKKPVVSAPRTEPKETEGLRIAVERPRDPGAAELFAMAVTAHRAGDLVTARGLYERVLALSPFDVDAMNNLGVLLLSTRDFDRAEQLLRRAVGLAPRNANVWSNLGNLLRDRGRSSDAVAAYQQALALNPQHPAARISLAQQYMAISSFKEARAILDGIVAENPGNAEAQYTLGQVLEQLGDRPGAIGAYTAFTRVAPPALAEHVERVRRRIEALSK